jgi:hypothetical protein
LVDVVGVLVAGRVGLFDGAFVRGEGVVPERVELGAHLAQAGLVNPVDAAGSGGLVDDEAGGLEDLEVLEDRGPGEGQGVGQLAYRDGRGGEPGEDGPPGGVAQRGPAIEHVSSH